MRVQDTVDDPPFDDVGADHCRVDGVRVLPPGRLGHSFPRVVEYMLRGPDFHRVVLTVPGTH